MAAATNGGSWRGQIITAAHNATSQTLHCKNWLGDNAEPVKNPSDSTKFTLPHNGYEHFIILGSAKFTVTLTS